MNEIVLTKCETVISNDIEAAETMNKFSVTVIDSLRINEKSNEESGTEEILRRVEKAERIF